jgi:hypothetical protein
MRGLASSCRPGYTARMGWRWVYFLGFVTSTIALSERSAQACSIAAPPPALSGSPSQGDIDVPTDVVPFYELYAAGIDNPQQASFKLESAAGDAVALSAQQTHVWTFALVPERPLQPQTAYTLSATLPASVNSGETKMLQLKFKTGNGPVATTPEPPQGSLQHYRFSQPAQSTCSPASSGTCVALTSGFPVEATDIDEFGQELSSYLYRGPWFTNLSGIDQGTNFTCVRLRTRAPNGAYSTPVDLCGAGAPLVTLSGREDIACTAAGITQGELPRDPTPGGDSKPVTNGDDQEPVPATRSSTACNLSGHPGSPSPFGSAALCGILLAGLMRRHRR